jgi:hypothetical protein
MDSELHRAAVGQAVVSPPSFLYSSHDAIADGTGFGGGLGGQPVEKLVPYLLLLSLLRGRLV